MTQRSLYLIRHGQYDDRARPSDGQGGSLTELGQQQAQHVAEWLQQIPVDVIYHSSLRRARETAAIIQQALPKAPLRERDILCECIPGFPDTYAEHFEHISSARLLEQQQQADKAFKLFCKRPRKYARHEVIVAHGNIIRYIVCRALQVNPELWVQMDMYNCAISEIRIDTSGQVRLSSHNDTGHLPFELRTD